MKTNWVKRFCRGLLLTGLVGAGLGLAGCADEYAAYPAYRGGYYAGYHGSYPYYGGYGYPYRAYGPYAGYYRPYYGSPYYGGSTVVVSRNRAYGYRDRYGHWHNNRRVVNRNTNRTRTTSRNNKARRQVQRSSDNDDESRYYNNQQH